MANPCWKCGSTDADTYRYCSYKKDFVCIACEQACSQYSRKLLPNGTNCRLSYIYPMGRIYTFLANSEEVNAAKEKYIAIDSSVLKANFENKQLAHENSDNEVTRAKLRVELAAIYSILEERAKTTHKTH